MKFKETVKSLILTFLICSSVILTSKIWFSEELWSQRGYNSFDYMIKTVFSKFFNNKSYSSLEFEQIFYPKQIVVNSGGLSQMVTPSSEDYAIFNGAAKKLLEQFFKESQFEEISENELLKAYQAPSVYYDFSSTVSFDMLGDYFNADLPENVDLTSAKHLLISLKKDSSGNTNIYVKNNKNKKIYKFSSKSSAEELNSAADRVTKNVSPDEKFYSYAFENSFDKPADGVDTKLLLDSYMVININSDAVSYIEPYIPYNSEDTGIISDLLNCFSMKLSSARQFPDKQQTENFVENFATLKIHKNGLLQYDAVDDSKGLLVTDVATGDYGFVKSAGDLAAEVYEIMGIDSKNIVFNSMKYTPENSEYIITFDYLANGLKTCVDFAAHPITVTIRKGKIVSLSQVLLGYNTGGDSMEIPSMITALDNFYSKYDVQKNKNIIIEDMYVVYYISENDYPTVKWNVVLSDGSVILI